MDATLTRLANALMMPEAWVRDVFHHLQDRLGDNFSPADIPAMYRVRSPCLESLTLELISDDV